MPQKTSPFIEGKYGWNLGESGWNGGMDENLVKFSYLFDRNIDQIVSSLPPEVNGKAYFNTTDNRIYYVVDGTYSSTPTPKWFELKLRTTGETYQYNGSSLVAVQSTSELEQELNDRIDTTDSNVSQVASDLSDLDTALKDGTNPNNGSAYLAKASVALPSIQSLLTAKQDSSLLYVVKDYVLSSNSMGGNFTWVASQAKSAHDGRDVISPTVPWDGTLATVANFQNAVGETTPAGLGCFVRVRTSNEVEAQTYGPITSSSLNKAIKELDTGSSIYTGGQISIPVGQIAVGGKVTIDNSSVDEIQGVTLRGRGKQASTLDFATQPAGETGIEFITPIFAGLQDMGERNSKGSGVKLVGQPTIPGAPSWNHINFDRVRTSFNTLSGVEADRGFMGHFNQVFSSHNPICGFQFKGLHTSLLFNNCYAASNTQIGYDMTQVTYSVMNACAADTNGIYGYLFKNSSSTVLNGCGSESNGRSGFAALSSTALGSNKPLLVNGFLAFNNNTANGGFPNAIYVQAQNSVANTVVARGCYSHDPANATTDATVDGIGAYLVDEYNEFPNGVASTNGGYIHHVAKTAVVRSLSVTAATNVMELQSTQGGQTSFSGEVLVTASNVQPSNTRVGNIATYKLLVNKDSAGSTVVEVSKIGQTTGATAASPSFTWTMSGNFLRATPVASTTGTFFFEVMTQGPVKVKV